MAVATTGSIPTVEQAAAEPPPAATAAAPERPGVPDPKPYDPVPVADGRIDASAKPDFGPAEKIAAAYERGELSDDDLVRYGTSAVADPASVPAGLRPTGDLDVDAAHFAQYIAAHAVGASEEARAGIAPTLTDRSGTGGGDLGVAASPDCGGASYEYLGANLKCRFYSGEFVLLYNIASGSSPGVPPAAGANGRPLAIVNMANALSVAFDEYRAMGYPITVKDDKPFAVVVGIESILGQPMDAPFVLPFGINQQPTMLMPPDPGQYDYLPRHELFHVFQYQFWDKSDVTWDYLWDFVGGEEFGSMNWWQEATAEWATHQTYKRVPFDPLGQADDYAHGVGTFLSRPYAAINEWDGLGNTRPYGAFLFPLYLTERTGAAFVRNTWENVRDHDHLPIEAIRAAASSYGLSLDDLLVGFAVANYRLSGEQSGPPPNPHAGFGYADSDRSMWRDELETFQKPDGSYPTEGDSLGGARPWRTHENLKVNDQAFGFGLAPGGAQYYDFAAQKNYGDPNCGYCGTLTIGPNGSHPDLSYIGLVWAPTGASGTLAKYPNAARIVYPNADGVLRVTDFAWPMVVTLVAVRTDLKIHSSDAGGDFRTYPFKAENLIALSNRSCSLRTPEPAYVEVNAAPETAFNDYAMTAAFPEWTGGDSTYSVKLPDGRILWIFSDTFLGPLKSDGTRPITAQLINSTFVIQNGTRFTTVTGGSKSSPTAIMPPSQALHWFWAGDGMITGSGKLQVVYQEYKKVSDDGDGDGYPDNWGFAFNRNVVATFNLANLSSPESVKALPSASGVAWASALMPSSRSGDGYTYVYGVNDAKINKKMRIARVRGSDLASGRWQFWTPRGWTERETAGEDSLNGIANEYSVSPWSGQFLLISQDSTEAFSGWINGYTSCNPAGPFGRRSSVYRMPEPGPYGSYWDGDIIAYNAHAHPELSSGNTWVISYNVNSMDTGVHDGADHYRDPSIYRPRFIKVTFV